MPFFHFLSKLWLRMVEALRYNPPAQRQQGSIVVPMAGVMLVGIVLLGSVHLGYMFYMKRELQNAADTAAMSGARALTDQTAVSCLLAKEAADQNLTMNLSPLGEMDANTTQVQCGDWNPATHHGPKHFDEQTDDINAIYVRISREQMPIMPFMKKTTLAAEAIAHADFGEQIAAFSVGPQLLNLDRGVLTNLLAGIGVDLRGTSVVDYQGLANVKITPSGLLEALGIEVPADITVGSADQLLSGDLKAKALVDIVEASITAANKDGLLTVGQLDLLNTIKTGIAPLGLDIQLLTDQFKSGLFALVSSSGSANFEDNKDKKAGLDAEVSLANILNVVLGVANQENAVVLNPRNGTVLDLGILKVQSQAAIINPPAIGIGGVGTQAHSANVRVFLRLCLDTGGCKSVGEQAGTGGILGQLLKIKIDIPLVVELVNATGKIEQMCHAKDDAGRDMADISVKTETAAVCIGKFDLTADKNSPHHPFSSTQSCTAKIRPDGKNDGQVDPNFKYPLLNLTLLGLNLASLTDTASIPALTATSESDFAFHSEPENISLNTKMMPETGNPLALGDTVKQITDSVLALTVGSTLGSTNSLPSQLDKKMAEEIWNQNKDEIERDNNCSVQGYSGRECRKTIYYKSKSDIESSLSGLQGFLKDLLGPILGLLGSLVTLNILDLLANVGQLLGNILGGVGELLIGDGCYHGGLLGEIFGQNGNEKGCKSSLTKLLAENSGGKPNALLVLVGMLVNTLAIPLNLIGQEILSPLLSALGLNVGQVETTLLYLDCQPDIRLVY